MEGKITAAHFCKRGGGDRLRTCTWHVYNRTVITGSCKLPKLCAASTSWSTLRGRGAEEGVAAAVQGGAGCRPAPPAHQTAASPPAPRTDNELPPTATAPPAAWRSSQTSLVADFARTCGSVPEERRGSGVGSPAISQAAAPSSGSWPRSHSCRAQGPPPRTPLPWPHKHPPHRRTDASSREPPPYQGCCMIEARSHRHRGSGTSIRDSRCTPAALTGMCPGTEYRPSSTAWMYRLSRPLKGKLPNSIAYRMMPSDQMSAI